MPQGIIIDGEFTLEAGVFMQNLYAAFTAGPDGRGIVAIIGDFPFLEPYVVYVATSRATFENTIAPNEPLIRRMSEVIYNSSRAIQGAPAAVVLISMQPSTQATVDLLSDQEDPGSVIGTFKSKIFGQRGNSSSISLEENADIGGYTIDISVMGVAETFVVQTSDESEVLTLDYVRADARGAWSGSDTYAVGDYVLSGGAWYRCILAHINHVPPNTTYWTNALTTSYGLETIGGGSGIVQAEKSDSPNKLEITFARTIPYTNCLTSANISFVSQAPVKGVISVTAKTGVDLTTATTVKALISGPTLDGPRMAELLTLTPDDTPNLQFDTDVTATGVIEWTGDVTVTIYPSDDVSGHITTGNFVISGTVTDLNKVDGSTMVADAIEDITKIRGFTASTGSNLAAELPLSKLDNKTVATLPVTFAAKMFSIEKAVLDQASFVEFEVAEYSAPDMAPTPVLLYLSGGGAGVSSLTTMQTALDELLKYDVHAVNWLTGYSTAGNKKVLAHCDEGWKTYQNERTAYLGVTPNSSYSALATIAKDLNSQRAERFHQRIKKIQYLGAVETQETPWAALMAMCAANINRRRSLDKWQPNIEGIEQNSELNAKGMDNAVAGLAFNVFAQQNYAQPYKLFRSLTTWLTDNNPYKTSPASVRSSADFQRTMRAAMQSTIENCDTPSALIGLLEACMLQTASQARDNGEIEDFDPGSINIVDIGAAYSGDIAYTPGGSKSQVKINMIVAPPASA